MTDNMMLSSDLSAVTERLQDYAFSDSETRQRLNNLSRDHIARRDSTQQNSFVELSRVGRYDQGFRVDRSLGPACMHGAADGRPSTRPKGGRGCAA